MRAPIGRHVQRVTLCLLGAAWAGTAAPGAEFTRSFRGRGYAAEQFRPTGANTPRVIRADAQGLRITLPANHGSKLPVGLVPRFGVRGDFEITMAFDILRVDRPTAGNGAGLSVYITMASTTREAATIGWQSRPGGEKVFFSHRASTPVGGKRKHRGGKPLATAALSGRLRLVRRGVMLSYQVAEGEADTFQELYQSELGDGDLDGVRFAAESGGSPTGVDVRVKSVRVRADDLPAEPVRMVRQPARWPLWLAAGVMTLLLALGCVWLWSRLGRKDLP
jgi:hypothetical protein